MTVTLYRNTADNKYLDKASFITPIDSNVPISPTSNLVLQAPSIVVDYNSSYVDCNYLSLTIESMTYYYYAKVTSCQIGKKIEFSCIMDSLNTYKEGIKNAPLTLLRSESIGKPTQYMDTKFPVIPNKKNPVSFTFPNNDFVVNSDGYCYILCVMNGGANNGN